jgi:selenocysteine lyase/cysteine desulfurase
MDDPWHQVIGIDEMVPTLSGRFVRYVNLDNAATAPALRSALAAVEAILPHYGSVHRGAGHKARRCTQAYEAARRTVGDFLGADPERDVVVFTKNTTEAINKLARSVQIQDGDVVLTTVLEHHSNDLPWRGRVRTVHVGATPDGRLDLDDLDRQLDRHAGRIAMLVVSGASNVTGVIPPIHELARRVHAAGGRILVDAAQLAPHRPIDMRTHDDPEHLDFVALSAHKLYAPFGSGAIVGCRTAFAGTPDHCGGGTVDAVTLEDIAWTDLPDREEAGTPNLLGAVAFAAAASTLSEIGWDSIVDHERLLLRHALTGLRAIPGLRVYGPDDASETIGVVPFTIDGVPHGLVAAILGYEHGIGVRAGCFCAHPYVAHLLGLDSEAAREWAQRVRGGDKRDAPGMVRISLGFYNDRADVDRLLDALRQVATGDFAGTYRPDCHGDYHPVGLGPTQPEPDLFHAWRESPSSREVTCQASAVSPNS